MARVVLAILNGTHAEGEDFCQSRPWKGACVSLYVVRCYGRLDVPESIASQTVAGTWFGEPIRAVLLEASLEQKQRIERLKHVLTVELAEPGVFTDDEGGAVVIREDYGWEWL